MPPPWRFALPLALLLLAPACRAPSPPIPLPDTVEASVPYELDTLDPHANDRLSNFAVASNFYEALVSLDADMGVHPRLAVRWENPDLLTWVFYLRKSVRFHDGRHFSAEDVVYSLERLLRSPELGIGLYVNRVSGVKALAPDVVEIRTQRPMSVLLNKLAYVLIVPKGEGRDVLSRHANGTGPYRFLGLDGHRLRMERNESYWGTRPHLRRATFHLGSTSEQALSALRSGSSQLVQAPDWPYRPPLDPSELTRRLSTFRVPASQVVPALVLSR